MAYLWQSKTSRKCFALLILWDGGGQMNSLLAWWQASLTCSAILPASEQLFLKGNPDHVIHYLKTFQMFPDILRINNKILNLEGTS